MAKQGAKKLSPEQQINIAIKEFNWAACRDALTILSSNPSKNVTEILIERIKFTGKLIEQRKNPKLQKTKADFKTNVIDFVKNSGSKEDLEELTQHFDGAPFIEEGFEGIFETLHGLPIQKLTDSEQIWSVIEWMAKSCKDIAQLVQKDLGSVKQVFDPVAHQITDAHGNNFRPDAVIPNIVDTLSNTLLMYGHTKSWFDSNGVLIIPTKVNAPPEFLSMAESLAILGHSFSLLESSDERWRFFGGTVSKEMAPVQDPSGRKSEISCIRFDCSNEDYEYQIIDSVANERLNRLILQAYTKLHTEMQWQKLIVPIKNNPPMPPKAYISDVEIHTIMSLSLALHIEVINDTTQYKGLTLIEWTRCFSWLREFICNFQGSESTILLISKEDIIKGLESVGIAVSSAEAFLKHATFSKISGDLFDSPLLLCKDGRYAACPQQLAVTNLPRSLLSLLSSLDVVFDKKGIALEKQVQSLFGENKIPCKGFKYKINNDEFEFDAVAVWDRKIFLFECKNRSLSGSKPSRCFKVVKEMAEAINQIRRLEKALNDHPQFLLQQFGITPPFEIIPCILNGLPFSMSGKRGKGAYIYDFSALSRFFEEGTIYIAMPASLGKNATLMVRRHMARLWAGDKPCADDLIKQLENPWQVKSLKENYVFQYIPFPIKDGLIGYTPFPRMVPSNIDRTLKSFGVTDVESEKAFIEETISHTKKLRKKIKKKRNSKKKKNKRRKSK